MRKLTVPVRTARLNLREFVATDFAAVHAYSSDPRVTRYLFFGPRDEQSTAEYLEELLASQVELPRTRFELAVEEIERVGIERESYEILGLKVPHVTIPVRPGRDIARLIEVAAMDQKLKGLGQNSAVDFNTKLLNLMEPRSKNGPA